jgi:PDZ domain-containing protein
VQEGQAEMIGSQDNAIASALRQLGYQVSPVLEIQGITPGLPAEGKLQPRDIIRRFAGTKVNARTNMVKLIASVPVGKAVPITVERKGKRVTVHVAPTDVKGNHMIGVQLGLGYKLPFKVTVDPGSDIGGPSAGLMFALSVYDLLTPGSLTGGANIAGTGEIDGHGHVGEIGGIQQKIVGARSDGAQLFLVPAANCADALTADHGSMRLAKVSTLRDAIAAVTAWTKNHDAPLPQCTATPQGSGS